MEKGISDKKLEKCITACLLNAERLIEEVLLLEYENSNSSRYYFSIISQEESAKSFLIYLVKIKIIPWDDFVLRAIRDHVCKQLIGIVIEYLSPDLDSFIAWLKEVTLKNYSLDVPRKVYDAINILKYEKFEKWKSKSWPGLDNSEYNIEAKKISDGDKDRIKQNALYVSIGKNAEIISTPTIITGKMAQEEFERAKRFLDFGKDISKGKTNFRDYEKIENGFRLLFSLQKNHDSKS